MNANGTNRTPLTSDPVDAVTPTWSPDNRKLAFASTRGNNGEIWVMDADGSDEVNVTKSPGTDWLPSWSPVPAPN